MTLFLFGAGATRGCSFVDPEKNPCLPFLDNDFFTQLQRVKSLKHQQVVQQVTKDVVCLFGVNFDVTMEFVFSTLEQMITMLRVKGHESRDLKIKDLEKMRDRLKQAIQVVLEESLTTHEGHAHQKPRPCEYHKKFVLEILQASDTILSFNYDCILDDALKNYGSKKWNPKFGYGFKLVPAASNLKGYNAWKSGKKNASRENTVHFYKLHGSLHFYIQKNSLEEDRPEVTLKSRPYTQQRGNPRFTIIPPEWHKGYDKGVFARLWRRAGDAITRAEHIVVIGYSFPVSDLHATSLFRTSLKKNSLKSLVVVNPDREARKRARTVMQSGLSEKTRVISVDTFKEFVAITRDVWAGVANSEGS